jgi:hypothetical protein
MSAEGATREEAHQNLRQMIQDWLAGGAEVVTLQLGPEKPPWARFAGTLDPDDPLIQEWERAVEEYRRKMDEDPDIP